MRLCRPERLKEDVEDCILPRRSPFKKREVALFLSADSTNFFMDDTSFLNALHERSEGSNFFMDDTSFVSHTKTCLLTS